MLPGDDRKRAGIIRRYRADEEIDIMIKEHSEYYNFSDCYETVEWLEHGVDRDTFWHDHENPMKLELNPNHGEKMIESALSVLRGSGSLEALMMHAEHCI